MRRRTASAEHRRVGLLGRRSGARADDAGVLLERRSAARRGWPAQERERASARVERAVEDRLRRRVDRHGRLERLEVVGRALVDQRGDGQVADDLTAIEHPARRCP